MKQFIITALTEQGKAALMQHWNEAKKKITFQQRIAFKVSGYKHELISQDPCVISVSVSNRFSSNPMFIDLAKGEMITALKENGAVSSDYLIEVK